jgi:hypothetical protein
MMTEDKKGLALTILSRMRGKSAAPQKPNMYIAKTDPSLAKVQGDDDDVSTGNTRNKGARLKSDYDTETSEAGALSAAEELIDAVRSGNAKGLIEAWKNMTELC